MVQKRLLIVSNFFPPEVIGGAEIVAQRQADGLSALEWDVAVFAGGTPRPDFRVGAFDVEDDARFPVFRLAFRSLSEQDNFRWPDCEEHFRSVLETYRPDVVHFHNVMGLGASLIPLAKNWGAKTVVTLHDHWGFCFRNTLLRPDSTVCDDSENCAQCVPHVNVGGAVSVPMRLRRDYVSWCLDQADLILSPSKYLAEAYKNSSLFRQAPISLSNGIDLANVPVAAKAAGRVVKLVSVGYIGEHKGIRTLLKAARLLDADASLRGLWELDIVGDGYLLPAIETDMKAAPFLSPVRLRGKLTHADVLSVLAKADALISAAIWPENQPVTLLEAIASGKAVIASRIGGNAELVEDQQSGLLFQPGNAEDLARILADAVRSPANLHRFGAFNAQRRVQFDQSVTLKTLDRYLRAVSTSDPGDDFIVICDGDASTPSVDIALHTLQSILPEKPRVRLVWHAWASSELWGAASLLWIWDDTRPLHKTKADDALRVGVPCLMPLSLSPWSKAKPSEAVLVYESLLEAIATIAAVAEIGVKERAAPGALQSVTRCTNALANSKSFYLSAQA